VARWATGKQAVRLLDLLTRRCTPTLRERRSATRSNRYVVAADVYGRPPHTGRGGWTWLPRLGGLALSGALGEGAGAARQGDRLMIEPRVAAGGVRSRSSIALVATRYRIVVEKPGAIDQAGRS